ncbi:MAG: hypothetical protein ACJAZO_001502 [Myxococcota bacterium]|jgi:hypothetical protein
MPIHGAGVGQVESTVRLLGQAMEGLTLVLWSVVTGLHD